MVRSPSQPSETADNNGASNTLSPMHRRTKSKHSRRFKSDPPPTHVLFPSDMDEFVEEEEAEAALVKVLEERRQRASSDDHWKSAVAGERPPLPRLHSYHPFQTDKNQDDTMFADLTLRIRARKAAGKSMEQSKKNISGRRISDEDNRIFDRVDGDDTENCKTHLGAGQTNTDQLISNAMAVDEVFNRTRESTSEHDTSSRGSVSSSLANSNDELLPLNSSTEMRRNSTTEGIGWFCCGFRKKRKSRRTKKRAKRNRFWCFRRNVGIGEVLNPAALARGVVRFVTASYFAVIGVPAALLALVLYYFKGDPVLDALPGNATLAWWLMFVAKQTLMLELAIYIEFFLVDGLALRSKWAVKLFGPLFTLSIIQAKGWPFRTVCWALLDLAFLHGDGLMLWGDLQIIKDGSGASITESSQYFRIMLAVLCAGLAHAIKRTALAMYFGKKTFMNYKAKLEKLIADIVLITEVAELASEIDSITKHDEYIASLETPTNRLARSERESKWGIKFNTTNASVNRGVRFKEDFGKTSFFDDEEKNRDDAEGIEVEDQNEDLTDDDSNDFDESDDERTSDESTERDDGEDFANPTILRMRNTGSPSNTNYSSNPSLTAGQREIPAESGSGPTMPIDVDFERTTEGSTTIGARKMLNFLERWVEPVNKLDTQIQEASIGDILKFRKALTYMDETHPFSECFGPANTRNSCIRSSQRTYRRLLKARKSAVLNFEVLALLAVDEEGRELEPKRRAIFNLFRPDRNKELSLLAFVQSCDTVYKRLRFFRAAVGNASVIDKVLEGIVDSVFNFILLLVILSMLQYNPWPLLVSISTLLVSLAFAVGPSTARYIEGVLLIAVRRPYDLGDRILIVNAENSLNQSVIHSWFVEDINLFSTTLRFAATNEVATVNNGAISLSRIVNFARSPRALVTIALKFNIDSDDAVLSVFKAAVERFVDDRQRKWEGINHFRCEGIETDMGLIEYSLRVRSTRTWQDAPGILNAQGELVKFCLQMGKQLGMNYNSPNKRLQIVTTPGGSSDTNDGVHLASQTQDSFDEAGGNTFFED